MYRLNFSVLILLSFFVFSGCSSNKLKNTKLLEDAARMQAQTSVITPEEAFSEARIHISKANSEDLGFYAPLHLSEAHVAFSKAEKLINSKAAASQILEECFKVKQIVLDGIKNKDQVKITLARSVDQLVALEKLGAEKFYPDEYKDRREDVVELITMLEQGETKDAVKDEAGVIEKLSELEIKTIYAKYIKPADEVLKKARAEKADELAAETYKKAEKELNEADDYVKANYKNHQAVEKVGVSVLRAANHAYYVAKEVLELKGMKSKLAEERVLYIESLFTKITQSMKVESGIGKSLSDQAQYISDKVIEVSNKPSEESLQEELKLNNQIKEITSENLSLKKELDKVKGNLAELKRISGLSEQSELESGGVVEIIDDDNLSEADTLENVSGQTEYPVESVENSSVNPDENKENVSDPLDGVNGSDKAVDVQSPVQKEVAVPAEADNVPEVKEAATIDNKVKVIADDVKSVEQPESEIVAPDEANTPDRSETDVPAEPVVVETEKKVEKEDNKPQVIIEETVQAPADTKGTQSDNSMKLESDAVEQKESKPADQVVEKKSEVGPAGQ